MSTQQVRQYLVGCCGTTTRVLETGPGGVPLVFLHGVGARADRWRRAMRHFAAKGRHCLAFDFPGHGLAGKPADFDYSVAGYASFTQELLNTLGIGEVVVVGTSLGGHVAGEVAVRRAPETRALVLVGTMGLLPVGQATLDTLADNVQNRSRAGIAAKLDRLLIDKTLITDGWIDEEFHINNSPGADQAFAALADYFRTRISADTIADALRQLVDEVPTLLVWGAEDVMIPAELAGPAQAALGGKVPLFMIPRTGHAPYLEAAEEFVAHVNAFLDDHAAAHPTATTQGGSTV
jgi:pimeloyl-ACP methyl ester carboxylesterase